VGEGSTARRPEVDAAREAALASRAALDHELVRLEASARAAVDVRAKVRRNPVKAAGIAAGVGFVAVGGPRRVFRRAKAAIVGPPEPLPESMLPKEIEASLKKLGPDGAKVRGTIEREFATYLEQSAAERKKRDLPAALAAIALTAGRPFVQRYAKQLADQLSTADPQGFAEQLAKVRARRAAAGIDEPAVPVDEPPAV
jgi:hypothetical protein